MEGYPEVELVASRALLAARTLELALHGEEGWSLSWGGVSVPATRHVGSRSVVFSGEFPDVCWISPPECGLSLLYGDMTVGCRSSEDIGHPGDTGFRVTWEISTPLRPLSI